jgi:hypothetical protein
VLLKVNKYPSTSPPTLLPNFRPYSSKAAIDWLPDAQLADVISNFPLQNWISPGLWRQIQLIIDDDKTFPTNDFMVERSPLHAPSA